MNITVIGQGYVGLVTAACFAEWGHQVTGIDANPERISALETGHVPFHEPGLDELVVGNVGSGRLRFTSEPSEALHDVEVVFVAVGTHDGNGGWQTATILGCLGDIVPQLADDAVLVIRSTLPPEFVHQVGSVVEGLREQAGRPPIVVLLNPEFTREGAAIRDFTEPERIVFGVLSDPDGRGVARLRQLYAPAGAPVLVLPAMDAVLAKLGANLFLATKISFVNELATLCDAFGATIDNVVASMAYDSRIGGGFLHAGVGFGGSCLPHQVTMTVRTAAMARVPAPLLTAVDHINHQRRVELVDRVVEQLDRPIDAARIALLGLTFKPQTDDLRDAPSLAIAGLLIGRGAEVCAYDPMESARAKAASLIPDLAVRPSAEAALVGADAAVLVTEWPEFRQLDWPQLRSMMRGRFVFDGRNALDPTEVTEAGLRYVSFGRGQREPSVPVPADGDAAATALVVIEGGPIQPIPIAASRATADATRARTSA
jgi:UDPglucose 6-dehydrogenase